MMGLDDIRNFFCMEVREWKEFDRIKDTLVDVKNMLTNKVEQKTVNEFLMDSIDLYLHQRRSEYKKEQDTLLKRQRRGKRNDSQDVALIDSGNETESNNDDVIAGTLERNATDIYQYSWIHAVNTDRLFEAHDYLKTVSTSKTLPLANHISNLDGQSSESQPLTEQVLFV
ncbi:hypothetical protein RFI_15872 [Reticulomyxa filosa]|uniref:Uncharacterized protein n=1 Tax=Reticulomyxa filosa TaxID=46433 RepID=X6N7Q2_RETFI|nr:hypothetical protein RFI_15872 [Reticulomyxa filosa]|eukprot:ETO21332.1 hypothetical protein RFI_15872 [Reticulomyxa filosa]